MLRAIRGATTAPANEPEVILTAVRELLAAMLEANGIESGHLVCAFFSATPDLDAVFPARAARELGWVDVALFGMQELAVPGAPERCLRVMLLAQVTGPAPSQESATLARQAQHVYLRGAESLRPDLAPAQPISGQAPRGRAVEPNQVTPQDGSVPAGASTTVTSLFSGIFTYYYFS